jgi:PAS domain S-box-containing protein
MEGNRGGQNKTEESEKFKAYTENAPIGIFVTNKDGRYIDANPMACRISGYTKEELLNISVKDFIAPDYLAEGLKTFATTMEIGYCHTEVKVRKKNGDIFWISLVAAKFNQDNVIAFCEDITQRIEQQETLRQSQLIVNNSVDAILSENFDGMITSWNTGATRMYGYLPQEMVGKNITSFLPAEMRDQVLSLLNDIKSGKAVIDYDTVRFNKANVPIPVSISFSPLKTPDGNIVGVVLVERDITERKKIEEKLKIFSNAIESADECFFLTDLKGNISYVNKATVTLFGYAIEEILRMNVLALTQDQGFAAEVLRTVAAKGAWSGEVVTIKKNNEKIFSFLSTFLIKDENGIPRGIMGIVRNITERKREEEHIKELNEIRSKFIDIISHQLGTPLTAVNWNLEAILDGDFGKLEDVTYKFLQLTHKSSVAITKRIHDLLTAMDIEEGRVIFRKEEVAVDSNIGAIVNDALRKCDLRGISCEYIAPKEDLPVVMGDNEKIRTAVDKLMENAITYTKENGKVTAKLELTGDMIHFEVRDTGIGIPATEQHRVFTRFFRGSNATTMQQDAFGLGLFIAKNFIEQQGGKIGFESKEGEGSVFWFDVPVSHEH